MIARSLGLVTFLLTLTTVPVTWAAPAILIDHADVLIDTPLRIRLQGFPPRQPATVSATGHAVDATTWHSRAVFRTDGSGGVDVSTTAPESGSYWGVSPMGLVWAMERLPGEGTPPPADSVMQPRRLTLRAEAPDGAYAKASVRRWLAGPGVSRQVVREGGVVGTLFLPPGSGVADVNAVVAYAPSGVLHGPFGPSEPGDTRPRAAWTHRGTPLPHLAQENRTSDLSAIVQRGGETIEAPLSLSRLRRSRGTAWSSTAIRSRSCTSRTTARATPSTPGTRSRRRARRLPIPSAAGGTRSAGAPGATPKRPRTPGRASSSSSTRAGAAGRGSSGSSAARSSS